MNVLTVTTLYPNAAQPIHGIFVEHRVRRLAALDGVRGRVIAPVPWFPLTARAFGRYGTYARAPRREVRHGLEIEHPRYLVVPKVGRAVTPWTLALAARRAALKYRKDGFDAEVIDAHYFYPDGVAATLLGEWLEKPVVITARGSDVNVMPQYRTARYAIRWAARRCAAIVCVCRSLAEELERLGIDEQKIHLVENGVDTAFFRPPDPTAIRCELGLKGQTVLSVGKFVSAKGHHLVLQALTQMPDVTAVIVGYGPGRRALERLARQLGVEHRVRLLNDLPQKRLVALYSAADAFVLASCREGMPNVVLEAMACGTPVVASRVGGVPELVRDERIGLLLEEASVGEIVAKLHQVLNRDTDRSLIRRHALRFAWEPKVARLASLFQNVVAHRPLAP